MNGGGKRVRTDEYKHNKKQKQQDYQTHESRILQMIQKEFPEKSLTKKGLAEFILTHIAGWKFDEHYNIVSRSHPLNSNAIAPDCCLLQINKLNSFLMENFLHHCGGKITCTSTNLKGSTCGIYSFKCSNCFITWKWATQQTLKSNRSIYVLDAKVMYSMMVSGINYSSFSLFAMVLKLNIPLKGFYYECFNKQFKQAVDETWFEDMKKTIEIVKKSDSFRNGTAKLNGDVSFMNKNNNSDNLTATLQDDQSKRLIYLKNANIGDSHYPQNLDTPTLIDAILDIKELLSISDLSYNQFLDIEKQTYCKLDIEESNSEENESNALDSQIPTITSEIRCQGSKKNGSPCLYKAQKGKTYCKVHGNQAIPVTIVTSTLELQEESSFGQIEELLNGAETEITFEECIDTLEELEDLPLELKELLSSTESLAYSKDLDRFYTKIIVDGTACEKLTKVLKRMEPLKGKKEKMYLNSYRKHGCSFKEVDFCEEKWHCGKSLIGGFTSFVKKKTKANGKGVTKEIREKLKLQRNQLLKQTGSLVRHFYRCIEIGNSATECREIWKWWIKHKQGDHTNCKDGKTVLTGCKDPVWNETPGNVITDPEILEILKEFIDKEDTLQRFTNSWANGSTSLIECFHSNRLRLMPKHKHFKKAWPTLMKLSALDFNENITKLPKNTYRSKRRGNKTYHSHRNQVRQIKMSKTYIYIADIFSKLDLATS